MRHRQPAHIGHRPVVHEVWALTTGEAGMTTQARSLAEALVAGLDRPDTPWRLRVVTARPARWVGWLPVSVWLPFGACWVVATTRFEDAESAAVVREAVGCGAGRASSVSSASEDLPRSWPDVVVSCGRRSARVAVALRRCAAKTAGDVAAHRSRRRAAQPLTVHVQDPRLAWRHFDALVLSHHDARPEAARADATTHSPLIVRVEGALHGFTPARLATLRRLHGPDFGGAWAGLPRPWIGVAVGGSTRRFRFDERCARVWAQCLRQLIGVVGGSLLLTSSRRTDPAAWRALLTALRPADQSGGAVHDHDVPVWAYAAHAQDATNALGRRPGQPEATGCNPYPALLALADALVVSGDSVSMVSEAVGTGRPVGVLGAVAADWSAFGRGVARFHRRWLAQGRISALDSDASVGVFAERLTMSRSARREAAADPVGADGLGGLAGVSEVERVAEALLRSASFERLGAAVPHGDE